MKVLKIKLLVDAYIIIRNTVCIYNMGGGGAEPPGFQTVTDYLIYTSRLCNGYYRDGYECHKLFIMPRCTCASEVYGSVFVCVSVCITYHFF